MPRNKPQDHNVTALEQSAIFSQHKISPLIMLKKRGTQSIWLKNKKSRHVKQSSVVCNATLWITTQCNLVHDSPCFGGGGGGVGVGGGDYNLCL